MPNDRIPNRVVLHTCGTASSAMPRAPKTTRWWVNRGALRNSRVQFPNRACRTDEAKITDQIMQETGRLSDLWQIQVAKCGISVFCNMAWPESRISVGLPKYKLCASVPFDVPTDRTFPPRGYAHTWLGVPIGCIPNRAAMSKRTNAIPPEEI